MIDQGFSVNGVIGSTLISLSFFLTFYLFYYIYKHRDTIADNKSVSTLTEEFKSDKYIQMLYYPLFFLRRFVYMCGICFLKDYPLVQVINNASFSFIVFCYIVVVRPYKECVKVIINSINELFLGIVFITTGCCLLDLSDDDISTMGMFLGIGTICVVGINGLLSILALAIKIKDKCKKKNNVSVIQPFDNKGGNNQNDTVVEQRRKSYFQNRRKISIFHR